MKNASSSTRNRREYAPLFTQEFAERLSSLINLKNLKEKLSYLTK